MLANGLFPISLCMEFTTAILFIGMLQVGSHLNLLYHALNRQT